MARYDLNKACESHGAKAEIARWLKKQPSMMGHYVNLGEYWLEIEDRAVTLIRKETEVAKGRIPKNASMGFLLDLKAE